MSVRRLYRDFLRSIDATPSRSGPYTGWRIVRDFLTAEQGGFDSDAEVVLRSAGLSPG